jgi:hypothetical protein
VDLAFIVINTIYFLSRVKAEFIDDVTSSSGIPTGLHHSLNIDRFINIIIATGIVALTTVKVLLYLRVNEEYGMISQLVFATIRDTFAFNIFIVIWILYFCVLFKIMGSMQNAGENY